VITGRTKHFLSLCGEHLSVDNMNKGIQLASNDLNISVPEFTVAGIPHGTLFAHRWYIGTDDEVSADAFRDKLDEHLKVLNDDYRVERSAALKDVEVTVLPTEVFLPVDAEKGQGRRPEQISPGDEKGPVRRVGSLHQGVQAVELETFHRRMVNRC
jgi:hypothetical protein